MGKGGGKGGRKPNESGEGAKSRLRKVIPGDHFEKKTSARNRPPANPPGNRGGKGRPLQAAAEESSQSLRSDPPWKRARVARSEPQEHAGKGKGKGKGGKGKPYYKKGAGKDFSDIPDTGVALIRIAEPKAKAKSRAAKAKPGAKRAAASTPRSALKVTPAGDGYGTLPLGSKLLASVFFNIVYIIYICVLCFIFKTGPGTQ